MFLQKTGNFFFNQIKSGLFSRLLTVFFVIRWGNTPLDEALGCGNKMLIKLLEDAKNSQISSFPSGSKEPKGSFIGI
jgi:hypothetical protein